MYSLEYGIDISVMTEWALGLVKANQVLTELCLIGIKPAYYLKLF